MKAAWQPSCLVRSVRTSCTSCRSKTIVRFPSRKYTIPKCRQFSTTPCSRNFAADPIDLDTLAQKPARVIPASPSYFTGTPDFTDNYLALEALARKYAALPSVTSGQAPKVAWVRLPQYRLMVGEPVRVGRYSKILSVLGRLNRIHPDVLPADAKEAMDAFKRPGDPYKKAPPVQDLDEYGRARGVGRRKSANARVYLVEGDGEVLINGKSLISMFPRIHDRESVIWALKATGRTDKYNVWALVQGGGPTGQAEALTLGLAKALLVHEPALKPALRKGETPPLFPPSLSFLA